jgi:hypothetical protein
MGRLGKDALALIGLITAIGAPATPASASIPAYTTVVNDMDYNVTRAGELRRRVLRRRVVLERRRLQQRRHRRRQLELRLLQLGPGQRRQLRRRRLGPQRAPLPRAARSSSPTGRTATHSRHPAVGPHRDQARIAFARRRDNGLPGGVRRVRHDGGALEPRLAEQVSALVRQPLGLGLQLLVGPGREDDAGGAEERRRLERLVDAPAPMWRQKPAALPPMWRQIGRAAAAGTPNLARSTPRHCGQVLSAWHPIRAVAGLGAPGPDPRAGEHGAERPAHRRPAARAQRVGQTSLGRVPALEHAGLTVPPLGKRAAIAAATTEGSKPLALGPTARRGRHVERRELPHRLDQRRRLVEGDQRMAVRGSRPGVRVAGARRDGGRAREASRGPRLPRRPGRGARSSAAPRRHRPGDRARPAMARRTRTVSRRISRCSRTGLIQRAVAASPVSSARRRVGAASAPAGASAA